MERTPVRRPLRVVDVANTFGIKRLGDCRGVPDGRGLGDGYDQRCGVPAMVTGNNGERDAGPAKLAVRLLADEEGQDLIEYALIFTFLAFGSVATMKGVATTLSSFFGTLGTTLTSAV